MNKGVEQNKKVIFFDLYQTLLDVELSVNNPNKEIQGWEVFANSLKKYGKELTGLKIQNLYVQRRENFYSEKKELLHHNMLAILTQVLDKDLELNLTKEDITKLIYEYRKASRGWLRLYPYVLETLDNLSRQYILAVASHTQGIFSQIELEELGIAKYFSYFAYTSDIGCKKTIQFYEACLKMVRRKKQDCVMIGDNYYTDVIIPQKLGMHAIWLKNPETVNNYKNEKEPQYSLNLSEIEKLPNLIEKMYATSGLI